MGITTISGTIQAQPLNDNFSYLLNPDSFRVNSSSNYYENYTSNTHMTNISGNVTLTLQHYESNALAAPTNSMRIYRDVDSQGTTASQVGGLIVYNSVRANCDHHEFGMFSILHNFSETTGTETVGIYSQVTARESSQSTLWAGVLEIKDTWQSGLYPDAANDHTLCALEIDVATHFTYTTGQPKLGISMYAYGGGECGEALRIGAGGNIHGVPGNYYSGDWRYGIRFLHNSIANAGTGISIETDHDTGIAFTNSANSIVYGINMAGTGSTALIIGSGYTNPIAIQSGKKIKLNGETNTQGIYWDSANSTVTFDGAAIGVANHSAATTATAGGTEATPATVTGYLKVLVNGFEKRIPYYNV